MYNAVIYNNGLGQYTLNGTRSDGKNFATNSIPAELVESVNAIVAYVDAFKTPEEVAKEKATEFIVTKATDEELTLMSAMFPVWAVGLAVTVGQVYRHADNLYRVVQAHTTQIDWSPNMVPALFAKIAPPGVVAEFVQPTGAHDAYNTDDHVMFEGKEYVSLIDANVWSPTAYPAGWQLVA